MRNGFGLIQAIFFILAISFVGLVAIDYSKISMKTTTDTYLKEQAEIFMQSAIEFSILAILNHSRGPGTCLNNIRVISKDQRFIANVDVTDYMLDVGATVDDFTNCNATPLVTTHQVLNTTDDRLNGSGIFYITIEANSTHPKMKGHQLRMVKRVWQKF